METLGVTWFKSSDDDSSAADVAGVTSGNAPDFAPAPDTEVLDDEQTAQTDITGGQDAPGSSTLVMDDPIGVLQLISSSQIDSAGRVFSVTVASSAKDGLLFAASVSGNSVGTVKISQPGGVTTLQNVLITGMNTTAPGSNITMTLESIPPKRRRGGPASSTLVMDDPIGVLQLISSSQVDSAGRVFNVAVTSSAKDALLFAASVSGSSVGTVKISQPGGVTTLRNVLITGMNTTGPGSNIFMTLESPRPAEISSE